jgi:hypothetical protein
VSINNELETLDTESVEGGPVISDAELLEAVSPATPRWPLAAAGALAFLIAIGNFIHAFAGGVAFGPWQGAYLDLDFPYRAPLLSMWFARAFVAIPFADRALCTVIASMVAGALACGVLAVAAAQGLRGRMPAAATALCGATAGAILAFTPIWTRLCTGGSPAAVTLVLALAGIGLLQFAIYATEPRWLLYAGLFFGLTSANDPSFVIVFLIALLAALGDLGERVRVTKIFAPMLSGFCIAAIIPLIHSFLAGESLSEFFSHAMNTTFPAIGDGAPQFGFGLELRPQFSWAVLGATIAGMTALFMQRMRGPAVTWGIVFLAMGPFWPSLTNQHASAHVLRDLDAPACMAYAAVCVGAGWGIAWIANVLVNASRRTALAAVVLAAASSFVVVLQFRSLPPRGPISAEEMGRGILNDCGRNAALVVGDSHTASLLRTLQIARGERRDVTVIPVHALEQPKWRERFHRKYAGTLAVPGDFPPVEAWKRWPLERPNEFGLLNVRLKQGGVRESDFIDLMLWELMRDNFKEHPIYFAGVSTPWLTARGERVGILLQYPRVGNERGRSLETIVPASPNPSVRTDPEFDRTVVALLLPLAEAYRRQDNVAESENIAGLARTYGADDAGAWLVSARAAARAGKGKMAEEFAANYIPLVKSEQDMQVFLDLIKEDLRRNSIASEFNSASLTRDSSDVGRKRHADLATQLWNLDELTVLSNAYAKAIQHGPDNFDLLYEGAAADVQLGELGAARTTLGRAIALDKFEAFKRVQVDGRFFLLFDADPGNFTTDLSG